MANDYALTTFDNPYDPFDQFELWLLFDKEQGYNTCEYLARVAQLAENMSEKEKEEEINRAMDKIIKNDFLNIYKKKVRLQKDSDEENDSTVDDGSDTN